MRTEEQLILTPYRCRTFKTSLNITIFHTLSRKFYGINSSQTPLILAMETEMGENPERNVTKMRTKKKTRKTQRSKTTTNSGIINRTKFFLSSFGKIHPIAKETKNGNIICMKFFVKAVCTKACKRAHKLTPGKKRLQHICQKCGSSDFQQGAEESSVP